MPKAQPSPLRPTDPHLVFAQITHTEVPKQALENDARAKRESISQLAGILAHRARAQAKAKQAVPAQAVKKASGRYTLRALTMYVVLITVDLLAGFTLSDYAEENGLEWLQGFCQFTEFNGMMFSTVVMLYAVTFGAQLKSNPSDREAREGKRFGTKISVWSVVYLAAMFLLYYAGYLAGISGVPEFQDFTITANYLVLMLGFPAGFVCWVVKCFRYA